MRLFQLKVDKWHAVTIANRLASYETNMLECALESLRVFFCQGS